MSSEIIRNKDKPMNQDALLRKSGRIRVDLEKLYRLRHSIRPYAFGQVAKYFTGHNRFVGNSVVDENVRRNMIADTIASIFDSLEAIYGADDLPPYVVLSTHRAIFRASAVEGTIEEIGVTHESSMPAVFVCEEVPL